MVSRVEAIQIARAECALRGWPWLAPIEVHWGLFTITVITNAKSRGSNVRIRVRRRDGAVVSADLAPS
jgi:hypothetical protein